MSGENATVALLTMNVCSCLISKQIISRFLIYMQVILPERREIVCIIHNYIHDDIMLIKEIIMFYSPCDM